MLVMGLRDLKRNSLFSGAVLSEFFTTAQPSELSSCLLVKNGVVSGTGVLNTAGINVSVCTGVGVKQEQRW